jgi:ribosomal protein S18 acetylase RimI-like enzyme
MNPRTRQWEVIGTIAIRMSDGEISSLVVDRRFRGLGIARKLLINVLNLRDKPFYAYVKKDNQASLNLFKSLGFVVTEESETAYRLELR